MADQVFKQELTHAVKVMSGWLNPSALKEKWSLMKSQMGCF